MQENFSTVPLVLSVDLAGELLGINRAAAYAAARNGAMPILPGPGRKKVPTAAIERLTGRRITPEDIAAATARLAPKREAFLAYQADFRAARAATVRRRS